MCHDDGVDLWHFMRASNNTPLPRWQPVMAHTIFPHRKRTAEKKKKIKWATKNGVRRAVIEIVPTRGRKEEKKITLRRWKTMHNIKLMPEQKATRNEQQNNFVNWIIWTEKMYSLWKKIKKQKETKRTTKSGRWRRRRGKMMRRKKKNMRRRNRFSMLG